MWHEKGHNWWMATLILMYNKLSMLKKWIMNEQQSFKNLEKKGRGKNLTLHKNSWEKMNELHSWRDEGMITKREINFSVNGKSKHYTTGEVRDPNVIVLVLEHQSTWMHHLKGTSKINCSKSTSFLLVCACACASARKLAFSSSNCNFLWIWSVFHKQCFVSKKIERNMFHCY